MVVTTSRIRRQAVASLSNAARECLPDAMDVEVVQTSQNLRERAERLLDREIPFIPSAEFDRLDAEAIQKVDLEESLESDRKLPTVPEGIPAYLASLDRTPLLTSVREQPLFRKYNFLKWLACREQVSLRASRPSRVKIERIEQLLARELGICKERVRQLQIRAIGKLRELAGELQSSMNLEPSMLEV